MMQACPRCSNPGTWLVILRASVSNLFILWRRYPGRYQSESLQ